MHQASEAITKTIMWEPSMGTSHSSIPQLIFTRDIPEFVKDTWQTHHKFFFMKRGCKTIRCHKHVSTYNILPMMNSCVCVCVCVCV
jgi:hypothetical protein